MEVVALTPLMVKSSPQWRPVLTISDCHPVLAIHISGGEEQITPYHLQNTPAEVRTLKLSGHTPTTPSPLLTPTTLSNNNVSTERSHPCHTLTTANPYHTLTTANPYHSEQQ